MQPAECAGEMWLQSEVLGNLQSVQVRCDCSAEVLCNLQVRYGCAKRTIESMRG